VLRGLGLGQVGRQLLARLPGQRLEVAALGAGHRLVTGDPLARVLDGARRLTGVGRADRVARPGVVLTAAALVDPLWRDEVGQASLFASGIHPGFALDQLVVTLTTQSKSIDAIHLYELGMYDDYAAEDTMTTVLGFGQPMESEPMMAIPGIIGTAFGGHIRFVADALGLTLSEVTEHFDSRPTDRTLDVAHGRVEAGTRGAIRMRAAGVVDGREVIVLEHITRVGRDIAPEWPIGPGNVTYRIEIEGDPDLECTLVPSLKDPDGAGIPGMTSGGGAMMASAMRVVNAIPYVVAAPPGLLRSLDLPLTVPTAEVFGSVAGATSPA